MPNYIEQLLAKLDDVDARTQFSELANKYTVINDFIVDPEARTRTEQIQQWADTEWDYEHGMSKLEYQQQQEIAALSARGNGMELNDLKAYLETYTKENGLMTKAEYDAGIAAKEASFNEQLGLVSKLATRIPYLNGKYQKDFGEMFDPDEFVKQAGEKGYAQFGEKGLDKFYDEFTAEKRAAKQTAEMEARAEAEATRRFEEKMKERGMGGQGAGPTLDGAPDMGHFESKMKGLSKQADAGGPQAPADLELGRGGIARFAAQAADAKDRAAGFVN